MQELCYFQNTNATLFSERRVCIHWEEFIIFSRTHRKHRNSRYIYRCKFQRPGNRCILCPASLHDRYTALRRQ